MIIYTIRVCVGVGADIDIRLSRIIDKKMSASAH